MPHIQIRLRLIGFSHRDVNKFFPAAKKMEKNPTTLFVVAAALIRSDGKICLQKRPENKMMAGLWEFPGGKVESEESPRAALSRELEEELGIEVQAEDLVPITFANEALGDRELVLLLYVCSKWKGEVRALESPNLDWFGPHEMDMLDMPPADKPFISALANYLQGK
jgi:8-oxo-dGTP diphosphatase